MKSTKNFINRAKEFLENDKEGIVKSISHISCYNDEPKFYHYIAEIKDGSSNSYHEESVASGTALEKKRAVSKLFGEILERYALTKQPTDVIKGSYNDLVKVGKCPLNPEELNSYDKKLFKEINPTVIDLKSEIFHWIEAKEVYSKKRVLIPAQLVYVPFNGSSLEPQLEESISTGGSCGGSLEEAIYGGACEVIERDSYMLHYLLKLPGQSISITDDKDKELSFLRKYISGYNLELFLVDMTTDLQVPSLAAIIIDRTNLGPAVSIGLKAGFDLKRTIIGAIEEAFMVRSWIRDKFVYFEPDFKLKDGHIHTIEERAYYWFDVSMIQKLDFWLGNKKTIKYSDLKKKFNLSKKSYLTSLVVRLRKKDIPIYYVNLTPIEMEKNGFFVVKVIIPSLQSLYLDEYNKYFGKRRLHEFSQKLAKNKKHEIELNLIPHPFL